jgi:hypothetical protein
MPGIDGAFLVKSIGNFYVPWVEVPGKALILNKPSHSTMPASRNNATFLTHESG